MSNPFLFKWPHFEADIILCAVRWYLRYALSYRDVEDLLRERAVSIDHTTVFRWVQRYAPEGIVKLTAPLSQFLLRAAYSLHEPTTCDQLIQAPSVPGRNHQPLCVALLSFLPQLPGRRGDDGRARHCPDL